MKILFGINNDNTVKGIVEFYEKKYNAKLEYKSVYYFKQFSQELSKGVYDRAVLLEDLENFPTNNYAQIDDYLFKNIDSMTDVFDSKNLIYIASNRRKLGDEFLARLFNLGIYTVLTGQDRTKGKVCDAIHKPYLKKDVKKYYDNVSEENVYKTAEVSEIEIQKIISYYQNQNGSTDKYNEIFDRISSQYTDEQLKIIIKFLPNDVKQHLSFNSKKYKDLMGSSASEVEGPKIIEPKAPPVPSMQEKPAEVLNKNEDAKAVMIEKKPEIVEKIVVKTVPAEPQVVTKVLEKQVVKNIVEVPKDYRKVVCFVGAPKVGTTFCINAVGTYVARSKVKTAIVDVTKKRDSYTIYTYDSEGKRNIAAESLKYASNGINEPLIYDKLSIYTDVPGEDRSKYNANTVIDTVMQNNNLVLIDADFTTPNDYFRLCQEIYLVQDMDVLNINQVTIFLRRLKLRGIPLSKVRVIINKHVKCVLTAKDILDGIATYTSYDLKMYDELLNSNTIQYYILPLDIDNYRKYIEMVYKYSNKFNTFSEEFRENLDKIINAIYPVGNITMTTNTKTYTDDKTGKKGFFRR